MFTQRALGMISYVYIYYIYTPNLGLRITVFDREREQGRFRGSSGGATREQRGSNEGAASTMGQCRGAAGGSLNRLPCTRLLLLALFIITFAAMLPGSASCCFLGEPRHVRLPYKALATKDSKTLPPLSLTSVEVHGPILLLLCLNTTSIELHHSQ